MGREAVLEEEQDDPHHPPVGLVVGSYCHDVLFRDGQVVDSTLGGAASFASNVLDALSPSPSRYVSKVGTDFAYPVSHPPLVSHSSPTTLFHAHFSSAPERVLRRVRACDPILPSDLPSARFDFGLAVGVAGEITPDALSRMLDLCRLVFVDAQALIRTFDPLDGTVGLVPLRDTGFFHLLPRIGFLKASAVEAPFIDVEDSRSKCCVVVTDGEDGCCVYWKDGEMRVPTFPTAQIDPTGAGDSFLGGFAAGLVRGLKVQDAALLGNFFGSLTVGQIGIPKLDHMMLQVLTPSAPLLKVKRELERATAQYVALGERNFAVDFRQSDVHENLQAYLAEAAKLACRNTSSELADEQGGR